MLQMGTPMFAWVPDGSRERVLRAGKVTAFDSDGFAAEFESPLSASAGADANLYAEVRGKFMQQAAVVVAVERAEPTAIIRFRSVGEAVSAESRGSYRVCVIASGIKAQVGAEKNCSVADVSPEGFAAIGSMNHAPASLVPVKLSFEGQHFEGTARVQTVKKLPNGTLRYGLLLPEKNSALRKAMQTLSMAMQRAQLRRLARSA